MNFRALINEIEAEEQEGNLFILERSDSDLLTDDLCEYREISYHIIPPTKEWIQSRMIWTEPLVQEGIREQWETIATNIAYSIDPDMLITLNKIIFTAGLERDEDEICRIMDCESWDLPSMENCIGIKWGAYSSVLIDIGLIYQTAKEMAKECGGSPSDFYQDGIGVTLIHELRHLGLDGNPFYEFPAEMASEDAVETWSRNAYESYLLTNRKEKKKNEKS